MSSKHSDLMVNVSCAATRSRRAVSAPQHPGRLCAPAPLVRKAPFPPSLSRLWLQTPPPCGPESELDVRSTPHWKRGGNTCLIRRILLPSGRDQSHVNRFATESHLEDPPLHGADVPRLLARLHAWQCTCLFVHRTNVYWATAMLCICSCALLAARGSSRLVKKVNVSTQRTVDNCIWNKFLPRFYFSDKVL